jgi:Zn-finger nucleic acid-binding protein
LIKVPFDSEHLQTILNSDKSGFNQEKKYDVRKIVDDLYQQEKKYTRKKLVQNDFVRSSRIIYNPLK